jgi:hypothetical protein
MLWVVHTLYRRLLSPVQAEDVTNAKKVGRQVVTTKAYLRFLELRIEVRTFVFYDFSGKRILQFIHIKEREMLTRRLLFNF